MNTDTTTTQQLTRADVLRMAEKLRRAAGLLEAHAKRCIDQNAEAHAKAINQARGMIRKEI